MERPFPIPLLSGLLHVFYEKPGKWPSSKSFLTSSLFWKDLKNMQSDINAQIRQLVYKINNKYYNDGTNLIVYKFDYEFRGQ